jgi:hypothetical protein
MVERVSEGGSKTCSTSIGVFLGVIGCSAIGYGAVICLTGATGVGTSYKEFLVDRVASIGASCKEVFIDRLAGISAFCKEVLVDGPTTGVSSYGALPVVARSCGVAGAMF